MRQNPGTQRVMTPRWWWTGRSLVLVCRHRACWSCLHLAEHFTSSSCHSLVLTRDNGKKQLMLLYRKASASNCAQRYSEAGEELQLLVLEPATRGKQKWLTKNRHQVPTDRAHMAVRLSTFIETPGWSWSCSQRTGDWKGISNVGNSHTLGLTEKQ